jgi:hypothetical protein
MNLENKFKSRISIKKYEIKYDTYKGSRNLKERSDKVIEIMYLVSKSHSFFLI